MSLTFALRLGFVYSCSSSYPSVIALACSYCCFCSDESFDLVSVKSASALVHSH